MTETNIGRHQEQYFWESICTLLFIFFFCACHLNAQEVVTTSAQTASTSKLNGTRWKLVSPTNDYCERYMSFTKSYRTTETKFIKENKQYKFPLAYYVSASIPKVFDKIQVGNNRSGAYIIQNIDDKVFWFKIIKFNDSEITLLSIKGQTTTYKRAL